MLVGGVLIYCYTVPLKNEEEYGLTVFICVKQTAFLLLSIIFLQYTRSESNPFIEFVQHLFQFNLLSTVLTSHSFLYMASIKWDH